MRTSFDTIFTRNSDGSISPRVGVHINGVSMGPGVAFGRGVSFGGVDLATLQGRDLETEIQGGVYVIKGVY